MTRIQVAVSTSPVPGIPTRSFETTVDAKFTTPESAADLLRSIGEKIEEFSGVAINTHRPVKPSPENQARTGKTARGEDRHLSPPPLTAAIAPIAKIVRAVADDKQGFVGEYLNGGPMPVGTLLFTPSPETILSGDETLRHQKRVFDILAEEGGGTWAAYMMMEIEAAFPTTPVLNSRYQQFGQKIQDDRWPEPNEVAQTSTELKEKHCAEPISQRKSEPSAANNPNDGHDNSKDGLKLAHNEEDVCETSVVQDGDGPTPELKDRVEPSHGFGVGDRE